jgi:hypothetical protein
VEIPTDSYVKYALELLSAERELIDEFSGWLPDTIVDCHVHSNPPSSVVEIDDEMYRNMVTTFPHFTIEQHRRFTELLYPGKTVILLPFTMPYRGIDFRAANEYLLGVAGSDPTVRPVLYGLPDDPAYTTDMLSNPTFVGLKMYMLYFRPAASRISEFFTDEILAHVDLIGGTVILHPPAPVTKSFQDIVETAVRFPNVTFIIAHMGSLTLSSEGVEAVYKKLAPIANLLFDTAIVPSSEILGMGLDVFGHKRILFGTDQPLSLVRANVCINPVLGERLATPYPYHWADPEEERGYVRYAQGATHLHWGTMKALREAIAVYGETPEVVQDIFCNNAHRVFKL